MHLKNEMDKSDKNCNYEFWFKFIFNCYWDKVIFFISLFVQNSCDAEDLSMDVFVSLWEKRKEKEKIINIENYLFILARNKSLNYLRKAQHNFSDRDIEAIDCSYHTIFTPESQFITKETMEILDKAIQTLPHKTKLAFYLVRVNKMKYKDAAEVLGVSVKTIEKQVAYAISKLKDILDGRNCQFFS